MRSVKINLFSNTCFRLKLSRDTIPLINDHLMLPSYRLKEDGVIIRDVPQLAHTVQRQPAPIYVFSKVPSNIFSSFLSS